MNRKAIIALTIAALLVVVVVVAAIGVSSIMNKGKGLVIIDFDCAKCRGHLNSLEANGPRMAGSDSEQKGAEYIVSQFQAAGLKNCQVETFSCPLFQVNSAEVSLVKYGPLMRMPSPLATPQTFVHMQDYVLQGYCGSYHWSNFMDDLRIVDIGDGSTAANYTPAQGQAALIDTSANTPKNPVVFQYANDAGVRAIILHNLVQGAEDGYIPIFKTNTAYFTWPGTWPDIPFMMVSKDMGDTLVSAASNSKLRLNIDVTSGPMDLCVAVGEIPGSEKTDQYYMLGAHHDTVYNGPGAVDNTCGASVVTQMAWELSKYKPKYTIRFCTFGGEEEGLLGSEAYFAAHESELVNHVKWYFNFDMPNVDIARGNSFDFTTAENSTVPLLNQIKDKMVEKTPELKKYQINITYDDGKWEGSDQWPFASHDIPVTNSWGVGSYEYHTYKDDPSHINDESLQLAGRIAGSFIVHEAC